VRAYLNSRFLEIAGECSQLDKLKKVLKDARVSATPTAVINAVGVASLDGGYQVQPYTLTDIYNSIWLDDTTGGGTFGKYKKTDSKLGLDFSSSDDRVVYAEGKALRHTHSCATVISLAASAGARLKEDQLGAALKASYDNNNKLNISLVAGEFISPIWAAFSTDPGDVSEPENRYSAATALWQWYWSDKTRASDQSKKYVLSQFNGLALYHFRGLSWETKSSASGTVGVQAAVFGASTTGSAKIEVGGETALEDYAVLKYGVDVPVMKPIPPLKDVAASMEKYAVFQPIGDWLKTPVTSAASVEMVHEISLSDTLCLEKWEASDAVSDLRTERVQNRPTGTPERCRFIARLKLGAPTSGEVSASYTVTLKYDKDGNGAKDAVNDVTLVVGKGERLSDLRGDISLVRTERNALAITGSALSGQSDFIIFRRKPGMTITSIDPNPVITVTCDDEAPATADAKLTILPSANGSTEIRIQIDDAHTTVMPKLKAKGGHCSIMGTAHISVAGVNSPLAVGLSFGPIAVAPIAPLVTDPLARDPMHIRLSPSSNM
jgi:hypothetical protein